MADDAKIKILMLDDEKFLLDIYRIKFERSGYEVTAFHDADDALTALRAEYHPDIILFDITMPQSRSGYEFIDTVMKEKLAKRSLKVALTNEGQDGEITRLAELGTDGHILKATHTPAELVTVVNDMLQEKNRKEKSGLFGI